MNKPGSPAKARLRPLAELAGKMLRDSFARQGFASTELVTRWPEIVGAEIAALAEPERIKWPRREEEAEPATLVLRAEGPAAIEVQHLAPLILEQVNRFFGWQAVGRLTLRQAPLRRRRAAVTPRAPDPAKVAAAAAALGDVESDDLRDALARLGAAVKSP